VREAGICGSDAHYYKTERAGMHSSMDSAGNGGCCEYVAADADFVYEIPESPTFEGESMIKSYGG